MTVIVTDDLEEFAHARQKEVGGKYLLPDGSNLAWQRDTIQDIAEELSDAWVLMELLHTQFVRQSAPWCDIMCLWELEKHLSQAWGVLLRVRDCDVARTQTDQIDVERTVQLRRREG